MADKKISALTAAGALDGTEVAPVVQTGATVKATTAAIADQNTNALRKASNLSDVASASTSRTNLGLGSLATVTPTGTPDGTKFLRDDNTWATPAGGGGGGSGTTTQFVNETGASFANFTALSGSWASSGGVIVQSATGGAVYNALANTKIGEGDGYIIQAEVNIASGGGGNYPAAYIGFGDSNNANPIDSVNFTPSMAIVSVDGAGTQQQYFLSGGIANTGSAGGHSYEYGPNVGNLTGAWHTLRLELRGGIIIGYLDGTAVARKFIGSGSLAARFDSVALSTYGVPTGGISFRNIKAWRVDSGLYAVS